MLADMLNGLFNIFLISCIRFLYAMLNETKQKYLSNTKRPKKKISLIFA